MASINQLLKRYRHLIDEVEATEDGYTVWLKAGFEFAEGRTVTHYDTLDAKQWPAMVRDDFQDVTEQDASAATLWVPGK